MGHDHFAGKSVAAHLKEARRKGALASVEIHGMEISGSSAASADAAREMALLLLIATLLLPTWHAALLLSIGWILWKTARSALLGYSRIERLHRLIEEERWEIEHHRGQEKEELTEMYRAKGLKGKLLEETIEVLMADDNRLLQLMLEEELGLTLEVFEHPLKQAFGAFLGAAGAALLLLTGGWLLPVWGLPSAALLILIASSVMSAKLERNRVSELIIWNIATALLVCGSLYFLTLMS